MLLHLYTWPEVESYLQTCQTIIIPIGSTEQHGPNGFIGTDAMCAEAVAKGVGEKTGRLVAPTINIGMAQHHLGFPGSMSLRPSTLVAVIADITESLARHGFRHYYYINGHGGNVATLNAAFSEVYAKFSLNPQSSNPKLRMKLVSWWTMRGVGRLSRTFFGDAEGQHATPSEVSLTWHLHPEQRKHVSMNPEIAPSGFIRDAADYRQQFPDGRIGSNPMLASAEKGAQLLATSIDAVADDLGLFETT